MSKYTDTLITINLDDYEIAKRKFKCDVKYVSGVGLDISKFDFSMSEKEKENYRKELGIKMSDFVMIYPAEINENKRQKWLITSLKETFYNFPNFHLLLPGMDSMNGECQQLTEKLGLSSQIHFLGFRKDVPKLLKISNLSVSTINISSSSALTSNVPEILLPLSLPSPEIANASSNLNS